VEYSLLVHYYNLCTTGYRISLVQHLHDDEIYENPMLDKDPKLISD
jgi:hypothetical protein